MQVLLLAGMSAAAFAVPPAGSILRNQAQASWLGEGSDTPQTLLSNVVDVEVVAVEAISLLPDRELQGSPGALLGFPHTLANVGNVATRVVFGFGNEGGDAFDFGELRLIHDLDGDGVADAGEPELLLGSSLDLAMGQSVPLLLLGRIPAAAAGGSKGRLGLAASTATGLGAQVRDTATVASTVPPRLEKSVVPAVSVPGGTVRYTLGLSPGEGWQPSPVLVDGALRQMILVRDALPPNTRFAGFIQSAGAQVLYHRAGTPYDEYRSTTPADSGDIDVIAFGFTELPAATRLELVFDLRLGGLAGGSIVNVATVEGSSGGLPDRVDSNPAVVMLPDLPGRLDYRDPTLSEQVAFSAAGIPLNLWAGAAACNLGSGVAEQYPASLVSERSGDTETGFFLTETGPNTGVFVLTGVPTARWPLAPRNDNDGVMQVAVNDTVRASLVCGGRTLTARILIDPAGVVFDSSDGAPVAGATVALIETGAGGEQPASVLGFDGLPAPNRVVTGADGFFQFPLVAAGNYRLEIVAPNGYRFPSQVPAAQQPAGRRIGAGSFGGPFAVGTDAGVIQDVPLDPSAVTGLMLEKQGARSSVEIGETLRYTLRLRNNTGGDLSGVTIEDRLPVGFSYVAGSARIGNLPLADPGGAPGRDLNFAVGDLAAGATLSLNYVARIGMSAAAGDGINQARARSGRAESNLARFAVEVQKGVFSDEALIVGKVFVDCNRDDLQGAEELGIPAVRLYLDDGSYAITDSEGKFSFYGVSPRTHALKLDRITLPAGAEMATVANRNAGDPHSRFVDLKKGELHRADFAEGSCAPAILEEVKRRRAAGQVLSARLDDEALTSHLRTEAEPRFDPRSRPASGIVSTDGKIVADAPLAGSAPDRNAVSPLGEAPAARTPSVSLEKLLPERGDTRLAFIDLLDGDTLPGTDLAVRLAGRDGSVFQLFVNDEEVPAGRVGQKARMPSRQLQGWEYIGIKLRPGINLLRAEARDPYGNLREQTVISLTAPGSPGRLQLVLPAGGAVADGQTPARIMLRLTDAGGVPVTARTLVTLEAGNGRWDMEDLDPAQPGLQSFVQGGEALFDLVPPAEPGSTELRASSGVLEDEARLVFNPYLRPLVASGVIEGAVGFNKLSAGSLAPVSPEDAFEQDIRRISDGGAEGAHAGVRGSMFLKGKIRGDHLLTLAYDSDKDTRDRLFRDIEPEHFYPVYGDSSIKGFDAQSTSPLYVRVDKGRSFLLYGDFNTTDEPSRARQLANYSRSLTGLRHHIESDRVAVNLFASHDSRRQQTTEFRAQGISGPYRLAARGLLRNSEKIEIVVRDRNQPAVVIETRAMTRFLDYTLDELDGTLMFTRPIAGVDAQLNPVFIRVTWEMESGGESFWVYGVDGRYRLTDFLELGASVVRDEDPDAGYSLYGVNATLKLAEDSIVTLEGARSEEDIGPSGGAWRAEWTQSGARSENRIYAGQTDAGFSNASSALSSGRREAGVSSVLRLSEQLRVGIEGLHTENRDTGGRRQGLYGSVEYALNPSLTLEAGLRHTREGDLPALADAAGTTPRDVTSARTKIGWNPEFLPKANLFAEYEQDVDAPDNRMLGVGGDYQVSQRGRLYARHELVSSLTGPFGLSELSETQNSTVFGLDYDYLEDANAFTEYRVRDALDGQQAQAAMGLRNGWTLRPGLRLTTQFERVQPIDGLSQENTAVALGAQYTADPLWKAGTRMEWRQSQAESSLLNTVALARKLSLDWSALGKNTASLIERRGGTDGGVFRNRLRLGLAWRQTDLNRWSWLGRYESRYDRDETAGERRHAQVLSSHVNWQPHRQWVLSGRYALKYVVEDNDGIDHDFIGHLLSGRVSFDITERWDAGINASALIDRGSLQYGVGGELGYLLAANLWASGGYNIAGYSDRDFNDVDYTRHGPYLRLRFKFDEDMFRWLE